MKKATLIIVLVIIALAIAAVWWISAYRPAEEDNGAVDTQQPANGTNNETPPSSEVIEQDDVTVRMSDLAFNPAQVTVTVGTTVTWINDDTVAHNVVADDPENTGGLPTDQPTFGQGESFSHTFNEVGVFNYHCVPHPFMTGTVEVVEAE